MSSNLINIGLSGLTAAQWGLTTTSENISNSTTPGYDVENPVYAESTGEYTGSGYLPEGVSTTTVQRAYSQYLASQLNTAQSLSSSLSANYAMLSQLNNVVGSPTSGISSAITSFFSGLENVADDASSVATRQTAISDAQALASELNSAGAQYDQMGQDVNSQLSATVSQINTYTTQIASLNQQISAASSQGQPPNQLLDQRDEAVSNLSQLVGVQVVSNSSGDSVFLPSGQALVSGTTSYNLGTAPSPADPTEDSITYLGAAGTTPTASTTQDLPDSIMQNAGGTLGGLIQFRTQSLDPAEAQLGAIATSFAAQVNNQNELGLDLSGNPGAALFSVAPPQATANANNTGGATLGVSFVNATQPTTGNYTLSYNGSAYTLTDNATGATVGSASNLSQPIDGLNFSLTGTMNPGDSFSVSPTSGALDSFALTTTSGSAIAAAAPVLATASSANTGTATISQGSVSAGYSLPSTTTTLTYNAAAGGFLGLPPDSVVSIGGVQQTLGEAAVATTGNTGTGTISGVTVNSANPANADNYSINFSVVAGVTTYTVADTSNSGSTTSPATAYTPGQPITLGGMSVTISGAPANGDSYTVGQVVPYSAASGATMTINSPTPWATPQPSGAMNGVTVTLSGTPANGDTFTIAANTNAQSDGRNAQLLSQIVTATSLNGGTATLTGAYADYVDAIGDTTNEVDASSTQQTAFVTQISSAQQSVSGVNINEEAANLLQYQQMYQANSQVIQTAQTLFQTILGIFQ
jgi:flagellar hook-associated protein 1 FlgK